MDGRTFDQMTRVFARQGSRRHLLGAVTAGLAVLVRGQTAVAQPTGCNPILCRRGCGFCNDEGVCQYECRDCEVCRVSQCRNTCTGGRVCTDAGCVCPRDTRACPQGTCVPWSGCCNNAECPLGQTCRADGGCVAVTCALGDVYCGECAGGGKACCPPLAPGFPAECRIGPPGSSSFWGVPEGGRACWYQPGEIAVIRYTCMPA
jgi:hypothetical protein